MDIGAKLRQAVQQWREDLIDLGLRNPLINFRDRRTSTLDLSEQSVAELFQRIGSKKPSFVVGTKPEPKEASIDEDDLEAQVIELEEEFDFSKHPDAVFVNRTQRDVDKVVRNLASRSARTFLDKGVNPLNIALGALRWLDDSEDPRVSPLALFPVRLRRPGARQPFALEPDLGDPVLNPALWLKMLEFGVKLPSESEFLSAFENDGLEAAMGLFQDVRLPKGWEFQDSRKLALFTFQKEAMFKDLLDNEEAVINSSLITALASGGRELEGQFFFEPVSDEEIDDIAPPESTPLILDADSSQRAAVQAAVEGRSFVLDGPPGTGKSQTISNIIGGLIAKGKTVLFVSEKIVALEVVKERLENRGLGSLVFELHSSKTSRKEVAQTLGRSLSQRARVSKDMSAVEIEKAKSKRLALSEYALAMNEIRKPLMLSIHQALGAVEKSGGFTGTPSTEIDYRKLSDKAFDEISVAAAKLEKNWDLHLAGSSAIWFGLKDRSELEFKLEALLAALSEYETKYGTLHKTAAQLKLAGTFDFPHLVDLLEIWSNAQESYKSELWLTSLATDELEADLFALDEIKNEVTSLQSKFEKTFDCSWEIVPRDMPVPTQQGLKRAGEICAQISDLRVKHSVKAQSRSSEAAAALDELISATAEFAETSSIAEPQSFSDLKPYSEGLHALASPSCPSSTWFLSRTTLNKVKAAAAALEEATAKVTEAANQADPFRPEALDLDLVGMKSFFQEHDKFWDRFKQEFRTRRKALKAVSATRNWKTILGRLPQAIEWRDKLNELLKLENKHSKAISSHYIHLGTDWSELNNLISAADQISTGITITDPVAFEKEFESPKFTAAVEHLIALSDAVSHGLEHLLSTTKSILSKSAYKLDLKLFKDNIVELTSFFNVCSSALETLEPKDQGQKTFSEFVKGFEPLDQFREKEGSLTSQTLLRFQKLGVEVDAESFVRSPAAPMHELSERAAWTKTLLDAARLRKDASGSELLTKTEFKALSECEIPDSLRESANAWTLRFEDFAKGFSDHRHEQLRDELHEFKEAESYLNELKKRLPEIDSWLELDSSREFLIEQGLQRGIEACESLGIPNEQISGFLLATVLRGWIEDSFESDIRLNDGLLDDRDQLVEQFRQLDNQLKNHSVAEIVEMAESIRPRSFQGQGALVQREAEKKVRHKAVRDQVSQSSEVIKALHPCFMMSPLAVSQFLPSDIRFDVVIFDEASQVTPSDAINCIYRGNALITAGDQKQLPPTKFFSTMASDEDDEIEEDVATDYESILDLMKASGSFNSLTLRWHYRSRHENLIAFSNSSFYGGNLITFPGAVDESADLGVKFFKVQDGRYRRSNGRDNPREAKAVAQRVIHHFDSRPNKSLGVVAFSTAQQDTIESAVALARKDRPDLDRFFDESTTDRQNNFFISNLESVQGDERDVIIFSVGYGPDETGKIYKNFGPISKNGGERRLNVAFTRARELVELVSSIGSADLGDVGAGPAKHLQRYLDYAERGPVALAIDLDEPSHEAESPFEESVISQIRSWGYKVVPQVGVAGYRIDIGVVHPNAEGTYMLGIECDGAMYHSSRAARDRDRLRHEILEGLGWTIHHIWGTSWYRHRNSELERLRATLDELSTTTPEGRVVSRAIKKTSVIEVDFEEIDEQHHDEWTTEYEVSEVEDIPGWVDLSEPSNARQLVPLVKDVVSVEQPVHIDTLIQRLRSAADLGRVGSRIRKTLDRAIVLAGVLQDGDFLTFGGEMPREVRRPHPDFPRDVNQIPPGEMDLALLGVTREAIALSEEDLIEGVCDIFGWSRKGSRIIDVISDRIASLLSDGLLERGSGGLKLP